METFKRVGMRFLRGAVSGSVASMAALLAVAGREDINNLASLEVWLITLSFAGIVGFVSGGLLALDKYFRS